MDQCVDHNCIPGGVLVQLRFSAALPAQLVEEVEDSHQLWQSEELDLIQRIETQVNTH